MMTISLETLRLQLCNKDQENHLSTPDCTNLKSVKTCVSLPQDLLEEGELFFFLIPHMHFQYLSKIGDR